MFSRKAITQAQAVVIIAVIIITVVGLGAYTWWLMQPAPEVEPIVVGTSLSLTGLYAKGGMDIRNALDIWVEEVNENGGLLGRNVTLLVYDDESDSAKCTSNYERLITIDEVDLVIGPYTSTLTLATGPIFEKYKFPCIHPDDGADVVHEKGWNYTFAIYPPVSQHGVNFINLMVEQTPKPESLVILTESEIYALMLAVGAQKGAENVGLDVLHYEEYPSDITTFVPLLQKVKDFNPDLLFVGGKLAHSLLITQEMKELDVNPKAFWFSVGPAHPDYIEGLGADAEYVYTVNVWSYHLTQFPGTTEWTERYEALFGVKPDYHPTGGYVTGKILELAVKNAGSLDKEKIREEILKIDTFVAGWGVKFTTDPTFSGANTKAPSLVVQIQNGDWVIVGPPEYKQVDAWYPTPPWGERP